MVKVINYHLHLHVWCSHIHMLVRLIRLLCAFQCRSQYQAIWKAKITYWVGKWAICVCGLHLQTWLMFICIVINWFSWSVVGLPTPHGLIYRLQPDNQSQIMPLIAGVNSSVRGKDEKIQQWDLQCSESFWASCVWCRARASFCWSFCTRFSRFVYICCRFIV